MAIKTIKIYATSKGYRNTNVWCDSSTKAVRAVEAYPNGGYTIFDNLPTQYKSATVNISYRVSNSKSYGYSGSNFKVSGQYVDVFSSSKNASYSYTGTGLSHTNRHSIIRDSALKPFDGSVGWSGEDDIQSFSCSVSDAYIEFQIEVPDSTIENLIVQGNFWERDISVNWRSQNQAGYEYELYYNNEKIKNGEGITNASFIIPANTFTGTLPASVRVRTYNTDDEGIKYYSGWVEQSISLKNIEATISDLIITGEYWEEDLTLSWQSTDQEQLKIEIYQDNTLLKTYLGMAEDRYKIPKNTFAAGEYLIKVWVGYANRFVNNQSRNITLKNIVPTLDKLSISGSNIDYDLIFSWESIYQDKMLIEIYKGDTKVSTINLTTEKSYIIANNTLETGTYTFKAKVAYTSATGDRWTDLRQLNVTLVESLPSIGALQPDGIIFDKNDLIKVWWTSQNQNLYDLEVVTTGYRYNGSTEKEHFIPMGTLQVGEHKIKLTITFITTEGVEKRISKEVRFIVTGKPNTPTITSSNTYFYNRPIVSWDSAEQLGFICSIEDMNEHEIWSSDWQNGLITRVKCMAYLPNGVYKAKVKIMNEFSDESDFAIKIFEVNVSQQVAIQANIQEISFGKKLLWTNENAYYEAFYIIRDDVVIGKTKKQEYIDYACRHGENTYKIRGVTKNDTYRDSNLLHTNFKLPYNTLATVDTKDEGINCGLQRNSNEFNSNYSIASKVIYLTGREKPMVISGEHVTEEYSLNFSSKDYDKFLGMCRRRKTFIYRDKLGKVLYLSITEIGLKIDRFGGVYTTKGLAVDYQEEIEYD